MRAPGPVGSPVVQERRALHEIRKHEMPAMRFADRGFLARLEADYRPSGPAAGPGAGIAALSLIVTGRQDSVAGFRVDRLDRMRAEQARDGQVPRR